MDADYEDASALPARKRVIVRARIFKITNEEKVDALVGISQAMVREYLTGKVSRELPEPV